MKLHRNLRDYRYGCAARYMQIICGLPSMWSSGASVNWIATPCDSRSIF